MSFGAQWLNDWEEKREDQGEDAKLSRKFDIPMAHFRTATTAPEPPPAPSLDVALRKVLTDELATVLASSWANQIADRIAAKVLALVHRSQGE